MNVSPFSIVDTIEEVHCFSDSINPIPSKDPPGKSSLEIIFSSQRGVRPIDPAVRTGTDEFLNSLIYFLEGRVAIAKGIRGTSEFPKCISTKLRQRSGMSISGDAQT